VNITALKEEAAAAREAGFDAAADALDQKAARAVKLAIAYEHYRFITKEQISAFQKKLKAQTTRPATENDRQKFANDKVFYQATVIADQLVFAELGKYPGLPPADVIAKVKEAKARGCFDGMEVAEVKPVATEVKLPDPIVFGRVDGCTDRFFIAQWGTDVNINDIINRNDG
jgi:hypothetical protein